MKYEKIIDLDWKYLMAPMAVFWFVAWFFIIICQAFMSIFSAIFDGILAIFIGADKIASK